MKSEQIIKATDALPPDAVSLTEQFVVPTYGRFPLTFVRGEGIRLFDNQERSFLDFGGGIAVNCLGHAHPELTETIHRQAGLLTHVSNLYYTEPQALLAQNIVNRIGPGKCFFSNSGAEANEALFKLARKFGSADGRFEILTTINSFHGRTLAGIAATGQDKVKLGFGPLLEGFRHVEYNNLEAMREALSPATIAVLVEGIQGESGIHCATVDYLFGLRKLCDENNLLMLIDGVQCGHFRTGCFQSFQRILENSEQGGSFLPDGISMAKSLGGGFPIGGVWIREPYADILGPGSHGTTFGGSPLACSVALKIMEIIDRDHLADHARSLGIWLCEHFQKRVDQFPGILTEVRGLGLMIGLVLNDSLETHSNSDTTPALRVVQKLHEEGVLSIPAARNVVRFLPALNVSKEECHDMLNKLDKVIKGFKP